MISTACRLTLEERAERFQHALPGIHLYVGVDNHVIWFK